MHSIIYARRQLQALVRRHAHRNESTNRSIASRGRATNSRNWRTYCCIRCSPQAPSSLFQARSDSRSSGSLKPHSRQTPGGTGGGFGGPPFSATRIQSPCANAWRRPQRVHRISLLDSIDGPVPPNGLRLSCGAELECSQTEFYNTERGRVTRCREHGRRQLQALVRLRTNAGRSDPALLRFLGAATLLLY